MTLYLQPENRAMHDKLTFGMILAAAVPRKRKVNNKKIRKGNENEKNSGSGFGSVHGVRAVRLRQQLGGFRHPSS